MKFRQTEKVILGAMVVAVVTVISAGFADAHHENGFLFWCSGPDGSSTCLNLTSDGGSEGYAAGENYYLKRAGNSHNTAYKIMFAEGFGDQTACIASTTLFTNVTDGGTVFTTASSVANGGFLKEGTQDAMRKEVTLTDVPGYYTTCGETLSGSSAFFPTTILVF